MSRSHRQSPITSHTPGSAAGQKPRWRKEPSTEGGKLNHVEINAACVAWLTRRGLWANLDFQGRQLGNPPGEKD